MNSKTACFFTGAVLLTQCAEAAFPTEISGTLRDTNGAPVAGMAVEVFPGSSDTKTKTETNGSFQIPTKFLISPNSNFVIARDRARNLAVARDLEDGIDIYDIQLAPAAVITGRVQNHLGQPLSNAEVTLIVWTGNSAWRIDSNISATTDAQGRFEIRAVPMGRYYGLDVAAKGYGTSAYKKEKLETNHWETGPFTLRVADKRIAGVVVDSEKKPVKGVSVSTSGDGQPYNNVDTDEKGRFAIDQVCDGMVDLRATYILPMVAHRFRFPESAQGNARVKAGDTNILITLDKSSTPPEPVDPFYRPSLIGKELPDLTAVGIPAAVVQTNKPTLVCLFDPEQRSSRRILQLLVEQNDVIKQKGVTIVAIQAPLSKPDALLGWKQTNPFPFAVGGVTESTEKTQWILKTRTLPWLILSDAQGRVKSDGFSLEDLDAKLNGPADPPKPEEPAIRYLD